MSKAYSDSCFSNALCEKCNMGSCYFNGGECEPGSVERIEVFRYLNEKCGRDSSFCG